MSQSVFRATSGIVIVTQLFVGGCLADSDAQVGLHSSTLEQSLDQFLRGWDDDRQTQHIAAFVDLNGDGVPEAIVYVSGQKWCGSGGCAALILSQAEGSWSIMTQLSVTRLPIRVLKNSSHGWRDLGVWVAGGGIVPGYEAGLAFDGKKYPGNPTVPPARRLTAGTPGEVVIGGPKKPSND